MALNIAVDVLDAPSLLVTSLKMMSEDEKFKSRSRTSSNILRSSKCLHQWCTDKRHASALNLFSKSVIGDLQSCLGTAEGKKEKMWALYHELRTSPTFQLKWTSFLCTSVSDCHPVFFQYLTDVLFNNLLIKKATKPPSTTPSSSATPLTLEEQNALRYVSGYIIRKVLEGCKKDSLEEETMLLYSFSEDDRNECGTEMWTNMIDRGGLWHVSDTVFSLFQALEEEIRFRLQQIPVRNYDNNMQLNIGDMLYNSEDVLSHWSILSMEIEKKQGAAVLKRIIKLFVTTRGHAFASSILELYKQHKQMTLQKRKSLRTELNK